MASRCGQRYEDKRGTNKLVASAQALDKGPPSLISEGLWVCSPRLNMNTYEFSWFSLVLVDDPFDSSLTLIANKHKTKCTWAVRLHDNAPSVAVDRSGF